MVNRISAFISADKRRYYILYALLVLLLCSTHPHHFSAITHIPNITVACMFLGGYYLQRWLPLAVFIALTVLLDSIAIRLLGTGDHCITVAYLFMFPAYAIPWVIGRWWSLRGSLNIDRMASTVACSLLASSIAFVFSNGGFYWYSGYFTPDWPGYWQQIKWYFAYFTLVPVIAIVCASLLHSGYSALMYSVLPVTEVIPHKNSE